MDHSDQDRLLALAGIYQAVLCVHRIATLGRIDTALMEPCIFSLFQTDAPSVEAVFGEPGALRPGVREFQEQLSGQKPRDTALTGYLIALLRLERLLAKRPALVQQIGQGIEGARGKLDHFALLHPNLLAHLADLYSRTISTLQPRIRVRGEPSYLQNPDNQNRIRALLLAGIRSAWLWRQLGGNRWQMLFRARRLLEAANAYLRQG